MNNCKSHTLQEIAGAMASGRDVWELDTANDGEDDTLIGAQEEVVRDVLDHFGLDAWPSHWTLTRV